MKDLTLNQILVTTDFSNASANALNTAIALAQQHHCDITLLHVIDKPQIFFSESRSIVVGPVEKLVGFARENLSLQCKAICRNYELTVKAVVLLGKVADQVCSYAREHAVDLIVVGKRGEFNTAGVRVGNVALEIVKRATMPVMCVPSGRLFTSFKKILFPIQEKNKVMDDYKIIRWITKKYRTNIVVAGITRKTAFSITPSRLIRLTQLLLTRLEIDGIKSKKRLKVCDDVTKEVIAISKEEEADLIFLPTEPSIAAPRLASKYHLDVLEESACPVLSMNNRFDVV